MSPHGSTHANTAPADSASDAGVASQAGPTGNLPVDVRRAHVAEPSQHVTVLQYSAEASKNWFDFATWYRIYPRNVATVADVQNQLRRAARYGVRAVSVPAAIPSGEESYRSVICAEAKRLGVRLLIDISTAHTQALGRTQPIDFPQMATLIEQWFSQGATGIELGIEILEPTFPTHIHAGYQMDELGALLDSLNPHAVTSIGLRGHDIDLLREHINDRRIQVIRSDAYAMMMAPHTVPDMLSKVFAATAMRNSVPVWPMTRHMINLMAGILSGESVALCLLALPGLVHFEHSVLSDYPSLRHALRLRDSHQLMEQKVAISSDLEAEVTRIFIGDVEVRINFNTSRSLTLADGEEVLLRSTPALKSSTDSLHASGNSSNPGTQASMPATAAAPDTRVIAPRSLAWIAHPQD